MKPLYKDFFRGMWQNKGKFISVFFIILLGAAFFSGLRSSKNDMLRSAEKYYDNYALFDLAVAGTAGLDDTDLADINALPEVEKAEGAYSLDVLCNTEDRNAVKLMSYSSSINIPQITDGDMPKSADECLLDELLKEIGSYKVGDTITFISGDENSLNAQLKTTTFTIAGFANLPQYMDLNRGTGSVGNGDIDGFVLVMPEVFTSPYYTNAYILAAGAKEQDSFNSAYEKRIEKTAAAIESIAKSACERRYNQLLQIYTPEQIEAIFGSVQWMSMGRESVFSYVNYQSDADRIASLGKLLPIVFFLVAALVSLTAMTRMVEEERKQIGTLKALGASNGSVLARYLFYALIPSLFGSVLGVLIGEKLFPLAILNTYAMLYSGLTSFVLPYNLVEGAIAIVASVLSTGIATLAACLTIVRERPAQIMRPEAPKPGKRVLLERVPFVWNKMKFTQKSTVRNLFRNKKRFLMTIIGVAGCMGLVLVGLGLRDSIMVVVDKQYDELSHYKATVAVQDGITDEQREQLANGIYAEFSGVEGIIIYEKSVDLQTDGGIQTVTLSVPQSTENITNFFTLRTRKGKNKIAFPESGAIISEKTAKTLGVSVGSFVTFKDGNSQSVSVKITGIFENYIGHYLFMSASEYAELLGAPPEYNEIMLKYSDSSKAFENSLGTMLLSQPLVQSVSFTSTLVDWANDTLSSLNTIVLIVLAAAALLAIVVLYNLNSINIAERKRELATLKVLGFYDGEVAAYIYKENIILTIIGILLGIVFGIFLHQYVIQSIEVDLIMFGRSIYWYSYLIGGLITLAFSAIINLVMYRSLKRIDMIESLKSVE